MHAQTGQQAHELRPRRGELIAVLLAGAIHVTVELAASEAFAFVCTAVMGVGFAAYVLWRILRSAEQRRAWGMRIDNLWTSLPAHVTFAVIGIAALLTYGSVYGSLELPIGFWVTLALYPAWGIAQQFALQNLVAGNLRGWVRSPIGIAFVASVLFAVAHYPRVDLVVLTFISGVGFTLAYRWAPNLWAVGTAHGVLGSLAVYLVLGEDPGRAIMGWFGA